eukprot:gene9553-biopygen8093
MIVIGADATGACEKFPSHVPCAFVTIPMGEIVEIFSPSGDGTFKTGATLELKIVSVPRYTTIYDTSDAGEGTCSLSCTTGDTPLHVGDRIGLHHGGSERVDHKLWITPERMKRSVANLLPARERSVGSANIFDKEVVVGCDMPAEMSSCIPQVSFQSMTSGDRLEIPRKKEKAVFIKWTTPIIIASNYTPDYKDTGDNIGRRIVSFRFDVAVPKAERDYGLKAKIMETGEIANFIHRALVEYDALRKRIRGDFWTAVPPIMIDWQSRLAVATNKLHEFLSMDNEDRQYNIEHIEGATTLLSTFKTVYKNVMQCTFEKDAGVFQRFGFRCSDTKVNVCKSCSKVSGKGCWLSTQQPTVPSAWSLST